MTSGDYVLEKTANEIIESALRRARIIPVEQSISDVDRDTALEALNNMIKRLQTKGYNLWKLKEYILPLEKAKASYFIGPTGDRCSFADEFIIDALAADVAAAATQITISDTSEFTGCDNVLNFDPTDAVADWTTANGALATNANGLTLTSTVGATEAYTEYTFDSEITVGREYFFQVDVNDLDGSTVRLEVYEDGMATTLIATENVTATGTATVNFTSNETTVIFRYINEDLTATQASQFGALELKDATTGEEIGIFIDASTREWNIVKRVIDGTTLELLNAQANNANESASVWAFKNKPPRPLKCGNIRSIRDDSDTEIPVNTWSRSQYLNQTIKTSEGTVTQAYYQPSLTNGRMYVWQVSDTVDQYIRIDCNIPIQVFNESLDEPDFPSEWFDALSWNLASEIGPEYGIPPERQAIIDGKALASLGEPEDWDEETGSLYIGYTENAQS